METREQFLERQVAERGEEIERLREALRGIDRLATRHVKGAIGIAQRMARKALDQSHQG